MQPRWCENRGITRKGNFFKINNIHIFDQNIIRELKNLLNPEPLLISLPFQKITAGNSVLYGGVSNDLCFCTLNQNLYLYTNSW